MRSIRQSDTREVHVHDRRHAVDLENPHVELQGTASMDLKNASEEATSSKA